MNYNIIGLLPGTLRKFKKIKFGTQHINQDFPISDPDSMLR